MRESGKPDWESGARANPLLRVVDLITVGILRNPVAADFEQSNTLGADARR